MQINHFKEKLMTNQTHQALLKKQLDRLGSLRVLSFVAGVVVIIGSNLKHQVAGYLIGAFLLVVFMVLVKQYGKVDKKKRYYEAEETVLKEYLARLGEEWKSFEENGERYQGNKSRVKDLDLLGRSSLYQYICTAHTPFGKRILAKELIEGHRQKKVLLSRQEAVKELIEDETFALHLQTLSMQVKLRGEDLTEESLEEFIVEAEKQEGYVSKLMKGIAMILPFVTLFTLVISLLGYGSDMTYIVAEVGFTLQLLIVFWQARSTSILFNPIFEFNKNIGVYKEFLTALENGSFKSSYLKELQSGLMASGSPVQGIESLNKLTDSIKLRHNFIANILLNGFLMWDIHCKDALGIWNIRYGKDIRKWLEIIGEVEALVSLSVIGRVKENYCFPTIIESRTPEIQFTDLAHPLIAEDKAVANSAKVRETTCIITGSNMSGKTTFLRSIGVNLALAYAGAPVVAKTFETSYMEVFTSMRIEDRVDEGISTFYAELLRIKEMIEYSERHLPMLVLIDEIFKGTNSADRILGATETIKKLGKPWLNVMVTTHDFELCNLANNEKRKTVNYHFEEYYEDQQIRFDYKLKNDRCKTTNAKYLLKMVGILE